MLIKKTRIPVVQIILIGFLPSFLKVLYYRLRGYKISSGVSIGLGSVVIGDEVEIGVKTSIGFFTIIRARQIHIKRFVKIGSMSVIDTEKIFIDDDARINEQVYIGGLKTPESYISLGKRTIIMQMSYLNPTKPIIIGDDSGIGGHCLLFTHGSWNNMLEGYPVKFAPITLGKKVWLPWRVFIMPGVSIGDHVVIGADSLINKDIPSNSLAAGSPAKIIRSDFPTPPTEAQKISLFQNALEEFYLYMKHHGYYVVLQDKENIEKRIQLEKDGKIHVIIIADLLEKIESIDLLILQNTPLAKDFQIAKMKISLGDFSRIGSSPAGEELVNFLSRFGIRFNRLD